MFGGTTLQCKETFGASASKGTLEHSPIRSGGWEYIAENNAGTKFGYISNSTASTLLFDIKGESTTGMINQLFIHYLRSCSDEWGMATANIVGGGELRDKSRAKKYEGVSLINSKKDVQEHQLAEVMFDIDTVAEEVRIINLEGKVKIVEVFLESCETSM